MSELKVTLRSVLTKRFLEDQKGQLAKSLGTEFGVTIKTHALGPKLIKLIGEDPSNEKAELFIQALDQRISVMADSYKIKGKDDISERFRGFVAVDVKDILEKMRTMSAQEFKKKVILEFQPILSNNTLPTQVEVANDFKKAQNGPKKKTETVAATAITAHRHPIPLVDPSFSPRNKTQAIAYPALMDPDVTIGFLAGYAGGGKSHVAARCAIELYNKGLIDKIMFFRPRTVAGISDPGAMPGNPAKKAEPFVKALGLIEDITGIPRSKLPMITAETPDFERGATYERAAVIVDEGQDLTVNIATLLGTRFGAGTKLFINGDISDNQNDLKGLFPGLVHLIATHAAAVNNGDQVLNKGTAFLRFTEEDSVARHPLLPHVLKALNQPPEDYAAIMREITETGRNSKLAVAISQATDYARNALEPAADRTYSRYVNEAMRLFPHMFGKKDNVMPLHHLERHHA